MATLQQNILQAISDFDNIREAIVDNGVEVPYGTDTKEYGNLIKQVSEIQYQKGYVAGAGSDDNENNLILIDQTTTTPYELSPSNGKLTLTESESAAKNNVILIDKNTGVLYSLYISNGKLMFAESEV